MANRDSFNVQRFPGSRDFVVCLATALRTTELVGTLAPHITYQGIESRGLCPVGDVVAIALGVRVRVPIDAQGSCRVELMPGRGQQPALVHGTVDGGLG